MAVDDSSIDELLLRVGCGFDESGTGVSDRFRRLQNLLLEIEGIVDFDGRLFSWPLQQRQFLGGGVDRSRRYLELAS